MILHNYLVVGAILFILGAIGFLARRNIITMFLSAEMMLQGVALNLIAFGNHHNNYQGQSFAIFILTVAACEAALALALIVTVFQRKRTLDVSVWQALREEGLVPDESPPVELEQPVPPRYPELVPSGHDPKSPDWDEVSRV